MAPGHTGGDLEPALVKAQEIAEARPPEYALVTLVVHVANTSASKADKRNAQRRK